MEAWNYFGLVDYLFMGIYLLILVGMGFYLRQRASRSLDNYICGGGHLPWWMMGVSGMANFLDLAGTAVIISFLFMIGPRGLFVEFRGGAVLVLPFMMLWAGKWHRRSGCLTLAEWNIFRFGDNWGGRFAQQMIVVSMILFTIGLLAYLIIGAGIFLSMFLPFSPIACSLGLIGFATLYNMISGFYGVVYTDLFQSSIIVAAVVYISIKAFGLTGGAEEISEVAMQVTGNPDWISGVPSWTIDMPKGYEAYRHLVVLMGLYLMKNIFFGAGSGYDQRYFGARNDRECGLLSLFWTALMTLRWPMMIGIALLGLYAVHSLMPNHDLVSQAASLIHAHYPDAEGQTWDALISGLSHAPANYPADLLTGLKDLLGADQFAGKLQLISSEGTINPEKILPAVLLLSVGEGMRGVLVIALIAAALSTFGSNVNLATGMMVNDFYKKWIRPKASTRELILASWVSVLLLVVTGFLFSITLKNINDIWGWLMMGLQSAILVPIFLRFYWWRFNGGGYAFGCLGGLVATIAQRALAPELNEGWQFVITLAGGLTGSIIGTYLTQPTDPEVLRNFYLKTRPFGIWGHIKKTLSEEEQIRTTREHRNDLIAVPFALLWQVTMFLCPMLALVKNWTGFAGAFILWLIGGAGLWFFWYRNLPATNYYEDPAEKPAEKPVEASGE
ncbi:sodium:solute symporter family transporter [Tichowtungia aerotolerans]|uniref:Sodium:solute symporter n=1 Tax=Tichowtungia aerotolerans TaxID=2697043 RepID=A0A6P1M6S1_9BACT|nr:sodium:solute symporter [Tichowtungia aerotolerans]QHI69712.1 sodium:solute symporter [Tichowtungia aerotolerans]